MGDVVGNICIFYMYRVKRWKIVGVFFTFETTKFENGVWFNFTVNMNVVWMARAD